MIVTCRNCSRDYDSSDLSEGQAILCECGDTIMIVDSSSTDGAKLVRSHIARLAREEGHDLSIKDDQTKWTLFRGSATIEVEILAEDQVSATATVIPLPSSSETQHKLFRRVLELNAGVSGDAKFAVRGDELLVVFSRSTIGLDYVEFHSGIEDVCRVADDYDDSLRAEFLGSAAVVDSAEDEGLDLSAFVVK